MKLACTVVAIISYALSTISPSALGVFLPTFTAAFAIYGIVNSSRKKRNPLNDVPNALRVLLAAAGGGMMALTVTFILPSAGLLLVFASLFLNDEFQRRTIDSVRKGRSGGSVALLGIDGSGKSTHASLTRRWLEGRGYRSILMPFHRYLFVEKLSSARSTIRGQRPPRGGNPLRPLLSLVDNLLLQLLSSFGCRVEGTVVLYDRFMWSTYIKYFALGYPVKPLSTFYLLPRPRYAVVLDVPVERSLGVISSREAHIRYPKSVLETERRLYLSIARNGGYPVIDSTKDSKTVQLQIEHHLSRLFPVVGVTSK
jgi:thymidylate kinase